MQTPTFKLKPMLTLGIMMACSALAVGCAGTGVNQLNPEPSPTANASSESDTPVALNESKSGSETPVKMQKENVMPVSNEVQGNTTEIDTTTAETTTPENDNSVTQEPSQTTFYFGFNKTELDDQDKVTLKQHAVFLKANPSLILQINGHTDHTGPHGYNEFLSKQRAEAVAKVLIADGIQRSQLVINALADDKPLADSSDPGKNRRVELQYNAMDMLTTR